MRNRHQPIAVEGYPFIGLSAFVTLVFAILGWTLLTLILLVLTLFCLYFFRNPERHPPAEADAIVAPADGKVIYVGKVREDRYFKDEVTKVSIFMSVFDVHVNRMPYDARVLDRCYQKGEYFNAALDQASLENERCGLWLELPQGQKMLCVQVAGLIARRIVSYPLVGDTLQRGERYGLIRFGSRVDLYFPPEVELSIGLGDRTVAGETVLGYLR